MKTSRLPIAVQQAVMRSLREKLARPISNWNVITRNPCWFINNVELLREQHGYKPTKSVSILCY